MIRDLVLHEIASYTNTKLEDVSLNAKLEDLGIDSLGAITIIFELEDKLDLDIPTESLDRLKNVDDVVKQIEKIMEDKVLA